MEKGKEGAGSHPFSLSSCPFSLFFADIGSGHRLAAQHVAAALAARGARVVTDDVLGRWRGGANWANRWVLRWFGAQYDRRWDDPVAAVRALRWLRPLFLPGLRRLVRRERPVAVVATHALPLRLLADAAGGGVFLIGVATDYLLNAMWPVSGVDAMCVASAAAAVQWAERGGTAPVYVTGIPIATAFDDLEPTQPRRDTRRDILIVAGGSRLGPYQQIAGHVRRLAAPLSRLAATGQRRVVVVTGRDRRLYAALTRWALPNLVPLPYVDDMPHRLSSSALLVAKPGGLIAAEAMAAGVPCAFFHAGYGQERRNAEYLVERGAAVVVPDDALPALVDLVRDEGRLAMMARRAAALGRPTAAADVAEVVSTTVGSGAVVRA